WKPYAGGAGFASVVAAVRMIGCGCEIKCYLVYSLSAGAQAARLLRSRMTSKHGMEWVLEHALLARSQVEGGVSPKTSFLSTDRRVLRAAVSVRGNSLKTVTRTVSNGAQRRVTTSTSDLDSCRLDSIATASSSFPAALSPENRHTSSTPSSC